MTQEATLPFVDRRSNSNGRAVVPQIERRQFGNSYAELSPEARELGLAVDQFKLRNRRRFITYEELLTVIQSLGYRRS